MEKIRRSKGRSAEGTPNGSRQLLATWARRVANETDEASGQSYLKYERVVEALARAIAEGDLREGERLPPQREIAAAFEVTIATVTKAIAEASRRGLVVARTGSGTFVERQGRHHSAVEAASDPSDIIDLSLNALPTTVVAATLGRALNAVAGEVAAGRSGSQPLGYEPIPGSPQHRLAGANLIGRRTLNVEPGQVLVTQGAHEGLLLSLLALTEPGDVVLCEGLNYVGLNRIGQMLRIRLVDVAVDEEGMDVCHLVHRLREHTVKAIVCTPLIHNPTTATLSPRRRRALVAAAKAANVPIIEDDILGPPHGEAHPPLACLWPDGVILVTSLSKTVSAGLRVGYVAPPTELITRIRDAMLTVAWTAPSLHAALASHLLETGMLDECIALHRREAAARLKLARRHLGSALLTRDDAITYHVWVDTEAFAADDIALSLQRRGVLVSPSGHFRIGDSPTPAAIRVSLGATEQATRLETALLRLSETLRNRSAFALGSIV